LPRGKGILRRYEKNPILVPNENNWWESKAVFNCAVLHDRNRFHMLYRAIGEYEDYVSRIGYAFSIDGYNFERCNNIAMAPSEEYERYGMEDPRLVKIEHQYYITYVVLSNYVRENPDVFSALATTADFNEFKRLGIVTSKSAGNKDVVLFPEKFRHTLDGVQTETYFSLHRPSTWIGPAYGVEKPSIWLGEGESLTSVEKHTVLIKPEREWEELKVGAGVPPIRTKMGWLVIYHGVSRDRVYSAGAAILDIKRPSTIIGRTRSPILEPEEPYERFGDVNNVVFPTGACIVNNELFVYYGGADRVCCLAIANVDALLDYILQDT
jgi:beta-1,2-mannobiose phosphorylase / 1,2-beta-oligomannan phosphorylase